MMGPGSNGVTWAITGSYRKRTMTKASRNITWLRAMLKERLLPTTGVVQVLYQAVGAASGLIVTMDVYKPDKTKDEAQSGTALEIGTTGRYYRSFNAEEPGWFVLIHDNAGGSAVKQY